MVKEITLDAVITNIPAVTAFVDEALEAAECPLKIQMQIDVAMDEIFTNISSYAYPNGTGSATVKVDFETESRVFTIITEDGGIPYNPMEKEDPDVTLSAEERGIGGLGIFLVKKLMDRMDYRYENGKNILTMQKKI